MKYAIAAAVLMCASGVLAYLPHTIEPSEVISMNLQVFLASTLPEVELMDNGEPQRYENVSGAYLLQRALIQKERTGNASREVEYIEHLLSKLSSRYKLEATWKGVQVTVGNMPDMQRPETTVIVVDDSTAEVRLWTGR